jgi:ribonuclease G
MHDILINWTPQETRVALIENGAVQDLHIERTLERGLVGNVYLGKVARVLPGMQSAFIDVGLERAAFLHVADLHGGGHHPKHDVAVQVPIERQVFEGQTLMVQVIKDPIGTKGARLSTQVSIAGRMLVFLPQDNHIGISQKIGSPEAREQLRERMQDNIRNARHKLGDLEDALLVKTREVAKATDHYVHENPWKSIGIAAGAGLIVGLLISRR